MDGFQSTNAMPARAKAASKRPPGAAKRSAWDKAMDRFQASLAAIKPAMHAHADADEAMFAISRQLEALTPPASLSVQILFELYMNDSMSPPTLRRHFQDHQLRDEAAIKAYAKADTKLRESLLADLSAWRAQRALLQTAHDAASAVSDARDAASSAAIARSDAQQLRLLRTPAPGLRELFWKIETLHKADCDDRTEELGWDFVVQEMAMWGLTGDGAVAPH